MAGQRRTTLLEPALVEIVGRWRDASKLRQDRASLRLLQRVRAELVHGSTVPPARQAPSARGVRGRHGRRLPQLDRRAGLRLARSVFDRRADRSECGCRSRLLQWIRALTDAEPLEDSSLWKASWSRTNASEHGDLWAALSRRGRSC